MTKTLEKHLLQLQLLSIKAILITLYAVSDAELIDVTSNIRSFFHVYMFLLALNVPKSLDFKKYYVTKMRCTTLVLCLQVQMTWLHYSILRHLLVAQWANDS